MENLYEVSSNPGKYSDNEGVLADVRFLGIRDKIDHS